MMSPSFLTLQQRQFLALIMITAVAFSNTQAQLVSAQANNNSGNAACFSLQGSVACPHLSAYLVSPPSDGSYTNVTSFDRYISSQFVNSTNFMSQFDTFYSCPTYNGAGIRYRISVMCQFLVQQSQCQQPSPVTPLCQDACSTFTASQSTIMSNSTLCPTNVTADITTRRSTLLSASSNPYVNFCTLLQPKSANPSCSMGVPYEALQCGFFNTSETIAACSKTGSLANDTSGCCQVFQSSQLNAMSGGLGPVNNTWIIIGVICGVFGLGIIIFFVYMACQKWKNRTTEAIPVVQSTYLEKRKTLDMSDNNNIRRGIPESVYSTAGAAPMMPPQSFKPGSTPSPLTPPPAVPRIPTLPRTPSLPRKMSNKGTLGTMSDGRASFNEVDGFNKMPSADMGFNDKFSVADTTDVIRMRVIDNYPAQMADELTLDLNDVVLADQTFDDGWALGKNVTKGTIGAFPLACCVPVGEDDNQDMQPPPPQRGKANVYSRTSSLFTSKR